MFLCGIMGKKGISRILQLQQVDLSLFHATSELPCEVVVCVCVCGGRGEGQQQRLAFSLLWDGPLLEHPWFYFSSRKMEERNPFIKWSVTYATLLMWHDHRENGENADGRWWRKEGRRERKQESQAKAIRKNIKGYMHVVHGACFELACSHYALPTEGEGRDFGTSCSTETLVPPLKLVLAWLLIWVQRQYWEAANKCFSAQRMF